MATVEEIAKDLLGNMDSDVGLLNACKWIDNRYKELVSKVRFRHLRQLGELSIPAPYTTGTVAVTRGSTAVVGTGTLWETNIGAGTHEYWWIKVATAWYRIASITDETNLVLSSAYAEDDNDEASYRIVKRLHPVATNARWLGNFTHPRMQRTLRMRPAESMDDLAPGRQLSSFEFMYWSEVGVDTNDTIIVEVYPLMSTSELITYTYWTEPSTLTATSAIPEKLDPYILKEGAYCDYCRFEMARALKGGQADVAATWRNEYRAAVTNWKDVVKSAVRTDRGADDVTMTVLQDLGGASTRGIETAEDEVRWMRGWNG